DAVGGAYAEAALRSISWEGRFLVIGFASGTIPKMPLNLVLLRGCDVLGVFWGESVLRDPDGHRENMQLLLDWVRAGKLSPHIHAVYPLDGIKEALGLIAGRKVKGKIIVKP
ncbi:MAG: zinc-binding dehydrogenase, partial [Hyphomicrobiales bacterium]|nr:zinc-binding dehydrogenase [Hyphomicrobiales bacterium]